MCKFCFSPIIRRFRRRRLPKTKERRNAEKNVFLKIILLLALSAATTVDVAAFSFFFFVRIPLVVFGYCVKFSFWFEFSKQKLVAGVRRKREQQRLFTNKKLQPKINERVKTE